MPDIETISLGQGGGPTPVHNMQVAGGLYEAQLYRRKHPNLRVIAPLNGLEGFFYARRPGHVIDITDWDPKVVGRRPGAVTYTTRMQLKAKDGMSDVERARIAEKKDVIRENIEKLGATRLGYFGGEDSAEILLALGFGVHGAKTEDNNINRAHHSSGWGSANLFNVRSIKNLTMDVGSYRVRVLGDDGANSYLTATVTVYQTQGRETGWLALGAGLAKVDSDGQLNPKIPPDIIWHPGIPFDANVYLSALSDILDRKGKATVVIGEELSQLVDGRLTPLAQIYGRDSHDPHGHAEHGRSGAFNYANYLAQISKALKIRSVQKIKDFPIIPQHIQRSYIQSKVDAQEAFEVGREVVRALLEGDNKVSVVLQKVNGAMRPVRVPLEEVAGLNRHVPPEFFDGIWGPTQAFVDEFLYLIGGPKMIPHYPKLDYDKFVTIS